MKTYILLLLPAFLILNAIPSQATIHTVQVGNFFFNPSTLNNVNTGDTIRWVWAAGSHTTTSSSIPAGASPWDSPITSSLQTFDYVPQVTGTYNYVCTPHASMGMVGSFIVVSAPSPLTVTAEADANALCSGQSTWLHAMPSGGTGTYSYSWTSNPPGFTSSLQNVQITPATGAVYTVQVTSGSQNSSASVSVTVSYLPEVFAGPDTTYCSDVTQIPVSGTSSNNAGVMWTSTGDGTFTNPTSLSSVYTPGVSDITASVVKLVLNAQAVAPCTGVVSDTLVLTLDNCTGIRNLKPKNNLGIYPNPSTGNFTINLPSSGSSTLIVYDQSGRIVLNEKINQQGKFTTDFMGTAGVYEVQLISGNIIYRDKLVIINR